MIINTTFVVNRDIAEAWLRWLRMAYVAEATSLCGLVSPSLSRIVSNPADPDSDTFALQMRAPHAEALNRWLSTMQPDLLGRMSARWGERTLHFTTLLEDIEL